MQLEPYILLLKSIGQRIVLQTAKSTFLQRTRHSLGNVVNCKSKMQCHISAFRFKTQSYNFTLCAACRTKWFLHVCSFYGTPKSVWQPTTQKRRESHRPFHPAARSADFTRRESSRLRKRATMHLMYYLDETGRRVYTLKVGRRTIYSFEGR